MATNHDTGYDYRPGHSTAGIIYNGVDGTSSFSSRFGPASIRHLPQVGSHSINVYSSSDGLIACHDPLSNIYYIGNPEIPDSYTALPETPREHNPYNSNVVLVSDYSVQHVYHLICAIIDGISTTYNFDVYYSCHGRWRSHERIDVGCYINPNTGVSCGTFAYWLTEAPRLVIGFNISFPQHKVSRVPIDRGILGSHEIMLQLGRVGNKLGLVTLDASLNPMVVLYFLEHGNIWQLQPHVSFNLPILNLSTTRLIRFQSFKVELFFWVDGQLFIWEKSSVDQGSRLQMVNKGEVQIGYGVPHVTTQLLPGNIPIMIQNIESDGGGGGGGEDDDDVF